MDTFVKFLGEHTVWAVFLFIFMILPIFGAIVHVIMKALGQKGIDNTITLVINPDFEDEQEQDQDQDNEKQ